MYLLPIGYLGIHMVSTTSFNSMKGAPPLGDYNANLQTTINKK